MFTGIIEEVGKVQLIAGKNIEIGCSYILDGTGLGDSIAVNGVCLTVTNIGASFFNAEISPETMRVSNLGNLKIGDYVNLERAMPINGRLGGHIVSGHIDNVAKLIKIVKLNDFYEINIELKQTEEKYAVKKGSITVNGISLTIADINRNIIKILVIPHTYENTNLKTLKSGDYVNIEVDILAKYIEKFLSTSNNSSVIDLDFLRKNGFSE